MAPKKGKAASALRPAPDWSWVELEDITSESELTEDHLRKAIGLESARPCRNKLEAEPEVTVIDLDGDDTEDQEPDGSGRDGRKRDAKGKGKASSKSGGSGEVWGPSCTSSWCQDNLLCLNHLGGKAWSAKDAHDKFMEAGKLGSPPVDRKETGAPVGLRNLGATCYANAFLQIWYYTLPFRKGIYACAASETHREDSPIFQLALTFAALQTSEKKFYDPTGLVNALRLDTDNQQDASEFSKLFMTHLQAEFSKEADPRVKTLIGDQFEGDLEYVTKCQECGYRSARSEKFLELGINLRDGCTLSDRLDALLAVEELSGANAYYCSDCESLQTARRKINIHQLPPILHFSLLRFVYDAKLGDRKKSKAKIAFPARIDMSHWLDGARGKKTEPVWYELRGVVEHRGASAHQGHFVCQVYDSERDQWYLCNDESVEAVDSLIDHGELPKPVSKSAQKRGLANSDVIHRSSNAYMLVYERSSTKSNDSSTEHSVPAEFSMTSAPIGRLAERITRLNREYDALCDDYEHRKRQLAEGFVETRKRKLEVMRVWNAPTSTEGFFLYLPSLKQWVKRGLTPVVKESIRDSGRGEISPVQEAGPNTAHVDTYQTDGIPELVTNGAAHPPIDESGYPLSSFSMQKEKAPRSNVSHSPLNGLGSIKIPQPATSATVKSPVNRLPPTDYAQSDASIEESDFDSLACELKNHAITCPHGKLDPDETKNTRVVSAEGLRLLKDMGCVLDIELGIDEICQVCVMEEVRKTKHRLAYAEIRKNFDRAQKEPIEDGEGFLLPKLWLKAWRKGSIGTEDDEFVATDWMADIACVHGKAKTPKAQKSASGVVVPPEAFACVASLTDVSRVPHFDLSCDVCSECLEQEAKRVKACSAVIQQAKLERDLLKEMTQKSFLADSKEVYEDMPAYLLSQAFFCEWLAWINDPIDVIRPEFSNHSLLCVHERLMVDPEWNPDRRAGLFTVIYHDLWTKIVSLYDVSPAETISAQRDGGRDRIRKRLKTKPEICIDCWKQRRSTAILTLSVETVNRVDDVPDLVIAATSNASDGTEIGQDGKRKAGNQDSNVRATKRQRETRSKKGRSLVLDIARDGTVLDIKKKVFEKWDILPLFQHLYHNGVELKENSDALGGLGLLTDDTVYVVSDETPVDGIEEIADDDEGEDRLMAIARERSLAGFNGTALLGLAADTHSTKATGDDDGTSNINTGHAMLDLTQDDPVQSCKACTFLNPLTEESCTVCGTPFD